MVKGFGVEKTGAEYKGVGEAEFRILFGCGAIPSAAVMFLTYLQFKGVARQVRTIYQLDAHVRYSSSTNVTLRFGRPAHRLREHRPRCPQEPSAVEEALWRRHVLVPL